MNVVRFLVLCALTFRGTVGLVVLMGENTPELQGLNVKYEGIASRLAQLAFEPCMHFIRAFVPKKQNRLFFFISFLLFPFWLGVFVLLPLRVCFHFRIRLHVFSKLDCVKYTFKK